ncbi:MAG: DUF4157 domain-containing protein [Bacteroidota bacterium]
MKTAETKTTSTSQQHHKAANNAPFFQKEGEGSSFLSETDKDILQRYPFYKNEPFFNKKQETKNKKPIQTKLKIGKPNDKYEKEADATADRVVRELGQSNVKKNPSNHSNSNQTIQRTCSLCGKEEEIQKMESEEEIGQTKLELQSKPIFDSNAETESNIQRSLLPNYVQTKCADCEQKEKLQKKEEEISESENEVDKKTIFDSNHTDDNIQKTCADCEQKEEAPRGVQAKSENGTNTASLDLQSRLESSKGSGQSLPTQTKTSMESAMGADFSNVRVHTGSDSIQMNRELGAQAFTHGSDIHFNEGKYDTGSSTGKNLLAHELTHTIQQGASSQTIQTKPQDHQHSADGDNVEKRMKEKAKDEADGDVDFSKGKGQLSKEEREQADNPDVSEKNKQKVAVRNEGTAKPDVDRPAEEKPKVEEASEEGKEKLEEDPEQKGEEKKEKKKPRADLAASDAKEQSGLMAVQTAEQIQMPVKREPFAEPNFDKPKDSKGEEVPGRADLTKLARGLYEMIKALAESAFQLIYQAAVDSKEGWNMRGKLDESWSKTRRVKAGSKVMKEDKVSREEVNVKEQEALTKVEADTTMVKTEAPNIMQESAKAKEESGGLVAETQENQKKMENEKPDDPDAAKDAEKQSEDTKQAAEGAETTDSAIKGTGDCAENYLNDAVEGEQKNQETKGKLEENKGILEQTGAEIARIDGHNAQSEAQLGALDHYPELVQKQTAKRAQSGEELYTIAQNANQELVNIQDEYLSSMAGLKSKEDAQAELDAKEKEENPPEEQALSPEEEMLMRMSNMGEGELDAMLMTMDEEELEGLNTTLDGMETEEEQEKKSIVGEADASGRSKVDLMKLFESGNQEQPAPDRRQEEIDAIEGKRESRLTGVKQTVDANFSYLSAEQKMMLSQKLAMQDAVSGLFDINILEMGKGMIMGMINPVESLKGVIDGASKIATGVYNLFCADAWRKDPLGTLLQSAADIATGLTTIFMSITGLATAITIISVALIIASWGTLAGIFGPIIGWMATVISTVGGWTVVTGLIALALNALTYIKNLHDASVAENSDQLLAESDQLKQNMTDGFTSAMAVVGGKGDKAGANAMKGKIKAAGGAKNFGKSKFTDFKSGAKSGLTKMSNFGKGLAKGAKSMTKKGVTKVKGGIQKAIQKVKSGVTKGADNVKGGITNLKNKFKGKKGKVVETPDGVRVPKEKGALGDVGGKKVDAEVDLPNGHTKKVLEDGQVATCSKCSITRENYKAELENPRNDRIKQELDDLEKKLDVDPDNPQLIKQHADIEAKLEIVRNPFENQMDDLLDLELAKAKELGVKPIEPGTPEFDAAINNGQVKWAVTQDGDLLVIPKDIDGIELHHSVISEGNPVLSAGEAQIAGNATDGYYMLELDNHSGHFKPSGQSAELFGKPGFEEFNFNNPIEVTHNDF